MSKCHNGQPKATIDHQGLDNGLATSSVVANLGNEDQVYWLEIAIEFGSETSSSISCASKIFWLKLIKPENLKLKLEQAKISANFFFLDRKLVNRVVRSVLLEQQETNDCALLEIQKTYASSLLLVLQAASDMSAYLTPSPGKDYRDYQIGIKSLLTKLKDSLSLVYCQQNLLILGEKAEVNSWLQHGFLRI